jgi:DNA-binding response OmpR family regulator
MSAYHFDRDRADILKLAAEQVCKPFDADEFVSRIESVLQDEAEQ